MYTSFLCVLMKSFNNLDMTCRIIYFVCSKGSSGASLKEIWRHFRENGDDFSSAGIMSQMGRLSRHGFVVESRERRVLGYQRRFYDPRFRVNDD